MAATPARRRLSFFTGIAKTCVTPVTVDSQRQRSGLKNELGAEIYMATQPQPDISPGSPDVLTKPGKLAPADGVGKRTRMWRPANNALTIGVISATVAILTSLLVSLMAAHFKNEHTATHAAGQQVHVVGQLETAANAVYQSTINVYNFQQECAQGQTTWAKCVGLAPDFPDYNATVTAFNEDISKVKDATAVRLADTFGNESTRITLASSALNGRKTLPGMQASYDMLIARCGQLVHEH
jgi:hypothetical protein